MWRARRRNASGRQTSLQPHRAISASSRSQQRKLGATDEMKWWPVSVGSHTTLLCVPGVPSGQFMSANMSACQDACVGAATCNGVNYLDGHGEGPSYCFLKNCTYPEFPPAISNGMFDYYSAAVYTESAPQPNPCDGITSRTSCDDLVYCNWCTPAILHSSCAQY